MVPTEVSGGLAKEHREYSGWLVMTTLSPLITLIVHLVIRKELYIDYFVNFPTPDSTDDAIQLIFTDFKRINETHFWSVSSKKWLHQLADKDSDNAGASYWHGAPYKGPG